MNAEKRRDFERAGIYLANPDRASIKHKKRKYPQKKGIEKYNRVKSSRKAYWDGHICGAVGV